MTLNEFKVHFLKFLKSSTVNLGRKTSKTRQIFIDEATKKFDDFMIQDVDKDCSPDSKSKLQHMNSSVMRIKPKDRKRALDIGKGVHAMTSSESMRADEQLNRSPYVTKPKDKEIKE